MSMRKGTYEVSTGERTRAVVAELLSESDGVQRWSAAPRR